MADTTLTPDQPPQACQKHCMCVYPSLSPLPFEPPRYTPLTWSDEAHQRTETAATSTKSFHCLYIYIYNAICTLPSAHMFTYIHIHIYKYANTYIVYTYTYKNDREKTGISMSRHQMFRLFQTYPLYLNKTYVIKVENNICLPTPIVPVHTYIYIDTHISIYPYIIHTDKYTYIHMYIYLDTHKYHIYIW